MTLPAADRAQHGAQATRNIPAPKNSGLTPFSIKQANAHDYDPLGDNKSEHPLQAKLVVDGERNTSWSTETYEGNTLGGKAGVGDYVVADPTVAARAMQILTPTKGWAGAVYVAKAGPVPSTTTAGSSSVRSRAPRPASGSTSTPRELLPLLPGVDHQASARCSTRSTPGDPPVQVGGGAEGGGIRSDPAR